MRHPKLIITLLLVSALAVGCKSSTEQSAVQPKPSETAAAKQLDKAKTETQEAAKAVQDYAYAQKAEFIDKMKQELAAIQKELDRLSAKVASTTGVAKAEANTRLEAVRQQWAQAKMRLDEAEAANESAWEDVKGGFKNVYGELKDSFEKTRQWLSDKIEP